MDPFTFASYIELLASKPCDFEDVLPLFIGTLLPDLRLPLTTFLDFHLPPLPPENVLIHIAYNPYPPTVTPLSLDAIKSLPWPPLHSARQFLTLSPPSGSQSVSIGNAMYPLEVASILKYVLLVRDLQDVWHTAIEWLTDGLHREALLHDLEEIFYLLLGMTIWSEHVC
ncbi:uncharacterized protein EI90DRAFT_3117786 [Cantharellus anzutake]|uniref:uncharacterized protein n=1 Tax=Cantharellus anzutake TaxID=1750568 RepID=UPI0019084A75|nr:uncharacterized protein EI90DRAFT_3117786 [Cantharellus anzutake]KAF8340019.1 hypothetical protein EI90DRAFT_3117786 [Cantharellus anzutake]